MEISFAHFLSIILSASLLGCLIATFPALHVFTFAGIVLIYEKSFLHVIPQPIIPFAFMSALASYSVANTLSAVFLSAPDESMIFFMLPAQRALKEGKAYENAILSGIGSVLGILILIISTPFVFNVLPHIKFVMLPHLYWILGVISVFLIMSEWPKSLDRLPPGWARFFDNWASLFAGILTFLLSGALGIIVTNRSIIAQDSAMQGLMPVFTGLFAIPWIIQNILSSWKIPEQILNKTIPLSYTTLSKATLAGTLGGFFAATFPAVTAGIGGLFAGHATAFRNSRVFALSQSISRSIYYVGAFLFFFIPAAGIGKGGMSAVVAPIWTPHAPQDYFIAAGVAMCSAGIAFLFLERTAIFFAKNSHFLSNVKVSITVLILIIGLVIFLTGLRGLALLTVSTAIGLIPPLFSSRRLNCLGVLLVPLALNSAGISEKILSIVSLP